jgi:hypothetical protein
MRIICLFVLASVVTFAQAPTAHADMNSTCENYAEAAMRQVQKSKKYPGCFKQGFFQTPRWTNNFQYHFRKCAGRYDAADKSYRAFTQGEIKARDGEITSCMAQFF